MKQPTTLSDAKGHDFDEQDYEKSESWNDPSNIIPSCFSTTNKDSTTRIPPKAAERRPSLGLLFSLLSYQTFLFYVTPGVTLAVLSGGLAPFMTFVIGQTFGAFAEFSVAAPGQEAKETLLSAVRLSSLELMGLAAGSFVLSFLLSKTWASVGEHNVFALRKLIFKSVVHRPMTWFDRNVCGNGNETDDVNDVSAAALMTHFSRDTDDVRAASSLASGLLIQNLTTFVTCMILAFQRSALLSTVILASVPAVVVIQSISQRFVGKLISIERSETSNVASIIERAVSSITAVKGYNAAAYEEASLSDALSRLQRVTLNLNWIWGTTSGLLQFTSMAMFIQAFWFGAKLVREARVSAEDVMAVFWACLIATSSLQMCIPHYITLAKGKLVMASVLTFVESDHSNFNSSSAPQQKVSQRHRLRRVQPRRCAGELAIQNVTFSYPSRFSVPVLRDASLFFPAGEMTFICGSSGSGKSTISQLSMNFYRPQKGSIVVDDQDLQYLDEEWLKQNIVCVFQDTVLFDDMSVLDNLTIGLSGDTTSMKKRVEEACQTALIHDFIRDLPLAYETKVGVNGVTFSGGQIQRLAIARALVINPSILILDEAFSALDASTSLLVFEAVKSCREDQTTIIVTHDLNQIGSKDFTYVLKGGQVAEQGYRGDLEYERGEFWRLLNSQNSDCSGSVENESAITNRGTTHSLRQAVSWDTGEQREKISGIQSLRLSNGLFPVVDHLRHFGSFSSLPRPMSEVFLPSRHEQSALIDPLKKRQLEIDISSLQRTGAYATSRRLANRSNDRHWHNGSIDASTNEHGSPNLTRNLHRIVVGFYTSTPRKLLVFVGLLLCLGSGAMPPIFSFFLSRLMFEVSIGATRISAVNMNGLSALGLAGIDGLLMCLKYFVMEGAAAAWLTEGRRFTFSRILSQDKRWFDVPDNSAPHVVQLSVKDADEAKNLIPLLGRLIVVVAMFIVGLLWAMVLGWQLTLVGVGSAPIFAVVLSLQSRSSAGLEAKNKLALELLAHKYHEVVSKIKTVRSMGVEWKFTEDFESSLRTAHHVGLRAGTVNGIAYGCTSGLIYLGEALLFYVAALLVSNGTYSYLRVLQCLQVVIFTTTIGAQLIGPFTQKMTSAVTAYRDFDRLRSLSNPQYESMGDRRPSGMTTLAFRDVHFSYPERPTVPVLKGLNLDVFDGEHIAIVGQSGSGKSTIAAMIQRMYQPPRGKIRIGNSDVGSIEVNHLRHNISVVTQREYLFNASVRANIAYGNTALSDLEVQCAAQAANAHEFICALPNSYDTIIGQNNSLLSGGQAQRIQIARALVNRPDILVLDESTSALSPWDESVVVDAISQSRRGRTTVWITHKLPIMQACDRIIVLSDGRVAEQGSYYGLLERKGVFASLVASQELTSD